MHITDRLFPMSSFGKILYAGRGMSSSHTILVLVAGTNTPSNSDALADACIQGIHQEEGFHVEKIRLKTLQIEHFTIDVYDKSCSAQEEDFCKVQKLVEEAAGVVIATPIWNFSVPAHLKNLIDRMGSFALDETRSRGTLKGKPFSFIFTGGAPWAAWRGLMSMTTKHLPESIRYFGGTPIFTHFEPKCMKGRGTFGLVVDERPESLQAVRSLGQRFARIAKKHAETGELPMTKTFVKRIYRWGQRLLEKF